MVFRCTFRVHWVDTDVAGVMHFSNFLRYFEACEEEFYRSLGMTLNAIREKYGIMLPRVEAHCEYKAPCRFDDPIEVTLKVREVARKTITYDFQLLRKQGNVLAAEGYIKCIGVNSSWKAVALPAEVAKAVRESTV
jgi:YbgC/YbaW family acyl-CoA thioester hydrolase